MNFQVQIELIVEEGHNRCACGIVLFDVGCSRTTHEAGYLLDPDDSANTANLRALLQALDLVGQVAPNEIEIRTSTHRLVHQITGIEPVADPSADQLLQKAMAALLAIDQWRIIGVDRTANRRAVELAYAALDQNADLTALHHQDAAQQQKRRYTNVPQWTVELLEEPGRDCPARCHWGIRYPFGPDTPGGFCVHALRAVMTDGPLAWDDPDQRQMTSLCPNCEVPLRMTMVE